MLIQLKRGFAFTENHARIENSDLVEITYKSSDMRWKSKERATSL